jgi:hypothetical protein
MSGGSGLRRHLHTGDGDGGTITVPAASVPEFLTGDSATFASTVGSWTANAGTGTAGTLTRDTAYGIGSGFNSLKWAGSTQGAFLSCAVSGTFKANQTYWFVTAISVEELSIVANLSFSLGDQGASDTAASGSFAIATSLSRLIARGNTKFVTYGVPWTPSADRTSVTVRVNYALNVSGSPTWHVGFARVVAGPTQPAILFPTLDRILTPISGNAGTRARIGPYIGTSAGESFDTAGKTSIVGTDSATGLTMSGRVSGDTTTTMWAEHTAGSIASNGLLLETGVDYLGLYISEKSSTAIQIYPDNSSGIDVEFRERNATKNFQFTTSAGDTSIPAYGRDRKLASAPGSPTEGDRYYDTAAHTEYVWNGSAWLDMTASGGTFASPTIALGSSAAAGAARPSSAPTRRSPPSTRPPPRPRRSVTARSSERPPSRRGATTSTRSRTR